MGAAKMLAGKASHSGATYALMEGVQIERIDGP